MSCHETLPLLPLFIDGELDPRQMRTVALHSTRCTSCEEELRRIERLQEAIAEHIGAQVDEIDLSGLWSGIAARIESTSPPWTVRLREWWESLDGAWLIRTPIYAGATAAVILSLVLWQTPSDGPAGKQVADIGVIDTVNVEDTEDEFADSVILDSLKSDAEGVALLREPETDTLVLWVSDNEGAPDIETVDFGGVP